MCGGPPGAFRTFDCELENLREVFLGQQLAGVQLAPCAPVKTLLLRSIAVAGETTPEAANANPAKNNFLLMKLVSQVVQFAPGSSPSGESQLLQRPWPDSLPAARANCESRKIPSS